MGAAAVSVRFAVPAGLLWILNACTAVTPRSTDSANVIVPATWSVTTSQGTAGDTSLASWWLRFHDALLAGLVADALRANTTVNDAEASLRLSQALRDAATAALFPTMDASGRTDTKTYQVGLQASWGVDIFGAQRSARRAADASTRASEMTLGDARVSVAAEVALSYILLRTTQARQAIANSNLATQQDTLQITLWRQQAGLVTALESQQARAAAEQTASLLPALQTAIDQAIHSLAVLTGRPPAALIELLVDPSPVPLPDEHLVLSLPAQTLRQRADVRAAEFQIAASQARVSQAKAARWPSFSISGTFGVSAQTPGALADSSPAGTVLATVIQPLFNAGGLRAQVVAQQAALEKSQIAYRAAVLLALRDVEDALAALRGDGLRLARLIEAADAADIAAMLARDRYSTGLADFQTVLETQRTQLGTQDGVAGARADVSSDYVRLYQSLGGGWESNTSGTEASTP